MIDQFDDGPIGGEEPGRARSYRIERHFTAVRYFAIKGTDDHQSHEEQNSMIRRYFAWRKRHQGPSNTSCHLKGAPRLLDTAPL